MTLKEWLKPMDLTFEVQIWGKDKESLFEGYAFEIPWTLVDYQLGRPDGGDKEPIFITSYKNENGAILSKVTINIIDSEEGGFCF